MLAKLKATFQSNVVRPLLFFCGMSSAKLPFIRDTSPCPIVMYYDCFMTSPLSLEAYRVVQVNCYKDMDSTSQHERVIVKITTADSGVFGYLCFERMRGSAPQTVDEFFLEDPTDTNIQSVRLALIRDGIRVPDDSTPNSESTSKPSPKSTTNSLSSLSSSLDNFQMRANAEDTVTLIEGFPTTGNSSQKKKNTGIQLVKTFTPRRRLPLCDLVALAYTIHIQNPIYLVFKEQCYWFANMIMCTLQREYGPDGATDITIMDEHVDEVVYESAGGKWHSIQVHTATESILGIISSQFKINLNAFKARLREVKLAEEQVKKDRIARAAAEEQVRKDRAARTVAEERAKQAEAKAGDLETRAKNSETRAENLETRAKDLETRAKDSETRAKDLETRAKDSEDKAREALLELAKLKQQLENSGKCN